jgi:hypothetical protein
VTELGALAGGAPDEACCGGRKPLLQPAAGGASVMLGLGGELLARRLTG